METYLQESRVATLLGTVSLTHRPLKWTSGPRTQELRVELSLDKRSLPLSFCEHIDGALKFQPLSPCCRKPYFLVQDWLLCTRCSKYHPHLPYNHRSLRWPDLGPLEFFLSESNPLEASLGARQLEQVLDLWIIQWLEGGVAF